MRIRPASPAVTCLVLAIGVLASSPWHPARAAGSTNGIAGSMPAYYDHRQFTINFKQFDVSQDVLLAKNNQQNTIWQSDPGLPGGQPFISVINAIPGDGMNPLWAEVQITFTAGHTPRQLYSDDEVNAAAASGEITLTPTNEMYRCSVIGPPPPAAASTPRASAQVNVRVNAATTAAGGLAPSTSWGRLKAAYR